MTLIMGCGIHTITAWGEEEKTGKEGKEGRKCGKERKRVGRERGKEGDAPLKAYFSLLPNSPYNVLLLQKLSIQQSRCRVRERPLPALLPSFPPLLRHHDLQTPLTSDTPCQCCLPAALCSSLHGVLLGEPQDLPGDLPGQSLHCPLGLLPHSRPSPTTRDIHYAPQSQRSDVSETYKYNDVPFLA